MKRYFYSSLILFSISFCLFLYGCKESANEPQNHLPKIESLTANPATVLINTETTLTCIATDEDGDNLTITWSSKRGTFPNGVVGVAVKWVAPSTAGTDTINVTVNDGKQTIQGKLEIIVGTIPANPTLLTPSNNSTEISLSPTLTWNAVSNAISYTLQVSTSNSFNGFVYNQSGLTNTNQQISGLNHTSTYYWRVSSTNIYGTSGWSNVFSFKTLAPPQAPTLLTPSNNSIEVVLSPTLTWNALNNAASYTLQVSTNNSFTSFIYNQSGLTSTSQQVSGLNYFTTYYWRVNATNTYGTSGWSTVWTFSTIGTAPQAPILSAPINSATNISLSPSLSWNGSNYATSYTLQVSDNSMFTNFVYDQSGLTSTSQQITGLGYSTSYFWRVSATNSYGTSSWSNYWSFTTISAPAPCPGIPTVPYAGKTYNTIQIGTQCWLKENLDVGTMIQGNQNQSNNGIIEKYCYNDLPANCITYGGLYQWAEVVQYLNGATNKTVTSPAFTGNVQGICPTGWHIPTIEEFQTLGIALSSNGNALKAIGQGMGSGAGTNTSGFSALLAGYRTDGSNFNSLGDFTFFWSSTEYSATYAQYLSLSISSGNIFFTNYRKDHGYSVRCLKD